MKKIKKISTFLFMLMLCMNTVFMPVKAATDTVERDGLQISLTTDKEEYSEGENVVLTLKVKNTNDVAMTDLTLEHLLADGFELTEESNDALMNITQLGAGEEVSLQVIAVTEADDTTGEDNSEEEPEENPEEESKEDTEEEDEEESKEDTEEEKPEAELVVDKADDVPNIKVPSLSDLLKAIFGDEEIDSDVTIKFEISKITKPSKVDKDAVNKVLGNKKIGAYFDIDLLLLASGKDAENITLLKDKIRLTLDIPEDLQDDKYDYFMIRVHDGKADVLDDLDDDKKTITIETDRFSTYALAYEEKAADSDSSESASADTTTITSPKTDDENNILLWTIVCIAAFVGVSIVQAVRDKKGNETLSLILCVALMASTLLGNSMPVSAAEVTGTSDEYKLVWEDNFEGVALDRTVWNVEEHEPGWVNAEWQEYVDSEENIYLKDGNLVIKPIKTVDDEGNVSYTSGRISTQNKKTFTYGKFEARVKVPTGNGYLPAFWLMANDENVYGQWPRCGEIDIMEVHGSATNKAYGTIHFGNPHRETQGTYTLSEGSFADEFHTFTCEWEPGKISWYVDGVLFHTADDWYSATEGQGELTYPAPFDQPFYIILNLAVGGSWVGYPDDTTDFENATYEVDYVKVYQKESYDENVTKPEKEVIIRDPDATGNYVINGDFAVTEDLSDSEDWSFLLSGGQAKAGIQKDITVNVANTVKYAGKDVAFTAKTTSDYNGIRIETTDAGTLDYSVQLVQPNIPLQKGGYYKLTFDASADEARKMIVDISAPNVGWIRYLEDSDVDLTTEQKTYTYEFQMTNDDDATARLEFNLGNQGSVAGVNISNVKLEKTGQEEIVEDDSKTVLTDGNYVYNGQFQEGENRLGYWTVANASGAEVSVTDLADGRRLKVVIPESAGEDATVTVSQEDLAFIAGVAYEVSYDAEGTVAVTVEGTAYESGAKFTANENNDDNDIVITFKGPGTYYIDNVRIEEDALIKNGDFSAGFAGYEPFVDGSAKATYVVDSLTEDNAADFTISNTGDAAWKVQLKQNGVELEKDQWYRLSFDAKSSIDRKLMFAIQRNGNLHNDDWTPYSGEPIVDLTSEYQNFSVEFQMKEETDLQSVLSISMGAVGGKQITEQHRICIDNILLEKIDAPEVDVESGTNLLQNGSFESGELDPWVDSSYGGAHTTTVKDNSVIYNITDAGTLDSHIQLKQAGLALENGATYKVSFKATSTEARSIAVNVMSTSYSWYGGMTPKLEAGVPKDVSFEFTMSTEDLNGAIFVSMGKIDDPTPASTITLSDFEVIKIADGTPSETPDDGTTDDGTTDDGTTDDGTTDDTTAEAGKNLIQNPTSESDMAPWIDSSYGGAHTVSVSGNDIIYDITDAGTVDSHIQLKQEGVELENGATYTVSFKATSTVARTIKSDVMSTSYAWYGGTTKALTAGETENITYTFTMTEDQADGALFISMGKIDDPTPASKIILSDFSLVKKATDESENILQNGSFESGEWSPWVDSSYGGAHTASVKDNSVIFDITDAGTVDSHIQLKQEGVELENGATYTVSFKATSTVARTIKSDVMSTSYAWYGGTTKALTAGETENITYTFTMTEDQADGALFISMGKIDDPTPASVITLSDFTLVKK